MLQVARALGVAGAGLSVFFLAQQALGLGGSAAFDGVRASYAAIAYPVAELFEPVVRLVERVGLSVPAWWRDGVAAYLLFGAASLHAFARLISASIPVAIIQLPLYILYWPLMFAIGAPITAAMSGRGGARWLVLTYVGLAALLGATLALAGLLAAIDAALG